MADLARPREGCARQITTAQRSQHLTTAMQAEGLAATAASAAIQRQRFVEHAQRLVVVRELKKGNAEVAQPDRNAHRAIGRPRARNGLRLEAQGGRIVTQQIGQRAQIMQARLLHTPIAQALTQAERLDKDRLGAEVVARPPERKRQPTQRPHLVVGIAHIVEGRHRPLLKGNRFVQAALALGHQTEHAIDPGRAALISEPLIDAARGKEGLLGTLVVAQIAGAAPGDLAQQRSKALVGAALGGNQPGAGKRLSGGKLAQRPGKPGPPPGSLGATAIIIQLLSKLG